VDYYNGWDEDHERALYDALSRTPSKFILSTWHHNAFRKNDYIDLLWNEFNVLTREHFYHVGASEENRNLMIEAIVTNYDTSFYEYHEEKKQEQLMLLEKRASFST
jgi:DNA adenine methylase